MKENIVEEWWKNEAEQNDLSWYRRAYRNYKFNIRFPVLDIGGGSGGFLKYHSIQDADILDIGGKESLKGNYNFIKADITKKLPNFDKKFKTIFIMETLEHIKNPLYLMAQVYDLLEDEGICYISIPYTKLDYARKNQKNIYNCHVCGWTEKEILDQMRKVGFIPQIVQKKRRFKNTAFWLPPCWLVLELRKRLSH